MSRLFLTRSGIICFVTGRIARAGAWVAVLGMVMLSSTEVLAMRYAEWSNDAANEGLMGTSYGIACT